MAAHKLQGRVKLYGFEISIENAKGSVRRWHDPHSGESGSTKMQHDYGYIRGTQGTDGDHVDVYVGPNTDSQKVFVIDQMKKPDFKKFDEQKCMLGFDSAEEAKAAYLKHYNDNRFFGSMREMSMDDFKAKVLARENHGKKIAAARLLAELNLAKLAAGEPIVLPKKEVLGADAGVDALPPVTAYSEATMSKDEREAADREVKTASDRVHRIADRVDDVGLAMLGAPSAAYLAGSALKRLPNAKAKALGTGLQHGVEKLRAGVHHGIEAGGLALVSPTVSHAIAKRVDKAVPQKTASGDMLQYFADHPEKLEEKRRREKKAALEKVAQSLFDDYEYKTEAEKTAILGMLGRAAGAVARGGAATRSAITGAGQAVAQGAGKMTSGLMGAVERAGTQLKGGYLAGRTGVSQARGEFAARAGAAAKAPVVAPKVPAVTPPAAVAKGGVPTPVPTTTAAPAAAAGGGKWNPLSARNVLLGGAAAGVGLGAYGGYKGIQTASHMLQNHHETPLAPPGFAGTGRVF